jgi:peptide-methionine (R)-S-oxide reductase
MNLSRRRTFLAIAASALAYGLTALRRPGLQHAEAAGREVFEVTHTDAEWRKLLSPNQYAVLRREGTEAPFTSPLNAEHRDGRFACAGCALDLFTSKTKFDSGTGWPSFWQPLERAVVERRDDSVGMVRTEVHCRRCGGHLGHVFDDGPKPTGLRYCMNGVALTFKPSTA